jgi:diketogulonate reductase-like aldo/keto reductase
MQANISDYTTLNNGVHMPWLGLGVYKAEDGEEVKQAIYTAVEAGYRSVDTAAFYENEEGVGEAIRSCGIARDELFVTTKLWNTDQGYESTLRAFEASRQRLGLDVIDLYLIHWPGKDKYVETWRAFEKLYRDGYVRAIGVSNFQIHHLEHLMAQSDIKPAVNQVEYHPQLSQQALLAYCQKQNIQLEAWSPLMHGQLDAPVLKQLAEKHSKTPAQIILRWDLQNEVVTIPKSVRAERIRSNADIFNFELSHEDMNLVNSLNRDKRIGPNPDELLF